MRIEEKYTVKAFYEKYTNTKKDEDINSLFRDVMDNRYVPIEEKITICENIMKASHFRRETINGKEREHIRMDSTTQYILYCMYLVDAYTTIKVNFKNILEEFNLLNSCGALDTITAEINDREKGEFQMILNMVEEDFIKNEYEVHAFVNNLMDRIENIVDTIGVPTIDMIQRLAKNTDWKSILAAIKR